MKLTVRLLVVAAALIFLAQGQVAHAATITVDTPDDELNSDGDCSLREAIQAANTDAVVDACTAGSGADTINVPAGTYTLSMAGANEDANASGDLDITGALTITGAGAGNTIVEWPLGGGLDRVFHILGAPPVTINGLTIQHGSVTDSAGGGIFVVPGATLTLESSTVRDNTSVASSGPFPGFSFGGGIFNQGTLTVTNVNVIINKADASGGILNDTIGTLTVNSSTVRGNSNSGITNLNTATINNTTVSGNIGQDGAGILNGGPLTVNNSTISGNVASFRGGGIFTSAGGTLTLNNTTVSGNSAPSGSGIFIVPTAPIPTLKNTIVANNTPGGDCSGSITSADHNLDSDNTCSLIQSNDLPNTTTPLLGALDPNGGPTETHALSAGSPAIDAGNPATPGSGGNACEATDQRGVARPKGTNCDIGAFELEPGSCTVTISKVTNPAGGTGFPFSSNFNGLWGITLDDGQSISVSLPIFCGPIFNLFECTVVSAPFCPTSIPPGSALTNIVCTVSGGTGNFSIIGATGAITAGFEAGDNEVRFDSLTSGSTIQCTFTNTPGTTPIVTTSGNKYCVTGTSTGASWTWDIVTKKSGTVPPFAIPAGSNAIAIVAAWVDNMNNKSPANDPPVTQMSGANEHCFKFNPASLGLVASGCLVDGVGCSFNPTVFEVEIIAVGGIAELPDFDELQLESADSSGGSSAPPYAALGGAVAAAVALMVVGGGWYARRRWMR